MREWAGFGSQSTPLQTVQTSCKHHATLKSIVKMAASRAGPLLRYFKRGREDEERKEEKNASNTGDSEPTGVKKAKKDRDFKPAWKKDFVRLVYNETKGKMFCQYCVNFPNSKKRKFVFPQRKQEFPG